MHRSKRGARVAMIYSLLDYLVGNGKQPRRKAEVKCFGSVEIDHELKLGRRHDRQIRALRALEHAANIDTSQPISLGDARSVAYQTAGFGIFTQPVDRREPVVGRQRNEVYAAVGNQR